MPANMAVALSTTHMSGIVVDEESVELTQSQQQIVRAFEEAASSGEAPPTYRELCSRFGWSSTGTARDHLAALVRKGVLRRADGRRNYRLARPAEAGVSVPIVGRVAAGQPILAVEHVTGAIVVPTRWARGTIFATRVEGDSMLGANIVEGDVIIAAATSSARDGEIVVARVGSDVTVKRLRSIGGKPRLLPENPEHRPVETDADTEIVGEVVGLVREFAWRKIGRSRWAR
jgi:repressor LexA